MEYEDRPRPGRKLPNLFYAHHYYRIAVDEQTNGGTLWLRARAGE